MTHHLKLSQKKKDPTRYFEINSDVSDSVSDSLLPSNPIISEHPAADTIGINDKEIITPIEHEQTIASNQAPENSALGTNNSENTNNLIPCTNIMENSTCAVMGANMTIEEDHLEIGIGLNTEDNVSDHAVPDVNLNDGEAKTSDLSCTYGDVEQRNTPIHNHANTNSDPYNDAPLSGALEKLSLVELTVANALLTLSCVTDNYVHRVTGNDQAVDINSQHPPTPAKEITDDTNDRNDPAGPNQVTDTWNLSTESTSAIHTLDPYPDSSDHSYCTIQNKTVTVADVSLVPTLQENDYVPETINTTYKVPTLQTSDSDIQIDMTSHNLMLNPFTSNLPEQPVPGINGHADQPTDILTAKYENAGIINESASEQYDSSSSAEFEGFNSDNLKPSTAIVHSDSNSSSDKHTDSDFEYEDVIEDSSDTIPAIENQPSAENTNDSSNDLQDLFLVRNQMIDANILKLWEVDVKTKKWEIPLCKLTSREVYDLSHPRPKWDEIDPYSGLEEDDDESSENQTTTEINSAHTNNSKYELRKRANTGKVTRKSNCISGK